MENKYENQHKDTFQSNHHRETWTGETEAAHLFVTRLSSGSGCWAGSSKIDPNSPNFSQESVWEDPSTAQG